MHQYTQRSLKELYPIKDFLQVGIVMIGVVVVAVAAAYLITSR